MSTLVSQPGIELPADSPNWVRNAGALWTERASFARTALLSLLAGLMIAFVIPKRYESTARLMPPDRPGNPAAMLAVMAGRSGSLSGLAGGLLGGRTTGALFVDLLHSRSISDRIIDRFHLQSLYSKRYRIDAVKRLAKNTEITEDKKSGAISVTVTDADPQRARDLAQAYVDELNGLVMVSNTSSARREREFVEKRLADVRIELASAQRALSAFSSKNSTLDVKEQTRAMVDAASRLQAQLVFSETELQGLEQIYGDANARVLSARARVGALKRKLEEMRGSSGEIGTTSYPSLRAMPHLAVDYTDLYREVKIHETVFELLSQQYEMARIEEAKDTPVVSVIDPALVPEKKSFPPRLLIAVGVLCVALLIHGFFILSSALWKQLPTHDARKRLWENVVESLKPIQGVSKRGAL